MLIQIKNATIVNEGDAFVGSVIIDGDRISEIVRGTDAETSLPIDEVIDASGCYLLPGAIDTHVHFRDPGLTHKGDFLSESKAAAAGGVTTVLDMPNTIPQTTSLEALKAKMEMASHKSVVNYGFYIGATNDNAEELLRTNIRRYCGIKIFMGASTGNMLVNDTAALERLFENARVPIVVHCEDSSLIDKNAQAVRAEHGDDADVSFHSEIRSEEACFKSTEQAVRLARTYGTRLHIAHVSTARELELITEDYPNITAEACLSYLLFTKDDYRTLGARIKCNPAIKTATDRDALRQGLSNGKIFTLATDHAPHRLSDKKGGCFKAASGIPMIQFSLLSMLEMVSEGVLSIERLAELMCHHPARLFSIDNRGFIREGYKADLVLVRPHAPWTLTPNRIESKCNWSPLEGKTFHWRIERTFCNGFPIYNGRYITNENIRGQAVTYDR